MKQQINLYVRQVKVSVPYSAAKCLSIFLVAALVSGGLLGFQLYQLGAVQTEAAALESDKRKLTEDIKTLTAQLKPPVASPALKAKITTLTSELGAKQGYSQLLEGLQPDRRTAFSALMDGLSNQAIDGLWLTRFSAAAGGRDFGLEGGVLKADLVPRFIERLGQESAYSQARFGRFSLIDDKGALRFQIEALLMPGGSDEG